MVCYMKDEKIRRYRQDSFCFCKPFWFGYNSFNCGAVYRTVRPQRGQRSCIVTLHSKTGVGWQTVHWAMCPVKICRKAFMHICKQTFCCVYQAAVSLAVLEFSILGDLAPLWKLYHHKISVVPTGFVSVQTNIERTVPKSRQKSHFLVGFWLFLCNQQET